jgi:hypothetical protein
VNEQEVNELLGLADAGAATQDEADPGLAGRAIDLARRRSRTRRVGYGVLSLHAAASILLVVVWLMPRPVEDEPMASADPQTLPVPISVDSHDSDALQARIAMQEAVVRSLLSTRDNSTAPRQAPDPLDLIQSRIDTAARRMVLTADRIEYDTGPSDFTRGLYKDVVTNFPDTDWARLARQRISEHEYLTEPRSAL